jgi:hypothetical protein
VILLLYFPSENLSALAKIPGHDFQGLIALKVVPRLDG